MPVWKKAKGNRITQLVADHIQSPKHGGSLVVETGFPTSLVDLFVKNRDRLKKPSKKSSKKKRFESIPDAIPIPDRSSSPSSTTLSTPNSHPRPNSPLVSSNSTPSSLRSPNSGLCPPSVCGLASGHPSPARSSSSGNQIDAIQDSFVVGDGKDSSGGNVVDANRVFVAISKMFLVVVLALCTKRFVVGITMSAFLLFFMEYAGKHCCRLFRPCANAQMSLQSLVQRVLCFVGIKRDKMVNKEDKGLKAQKRSAPVVADCFRLIEDHNIGGGPNQEIQIEEPSANLSEIRRAKYAFGSRSSKEKWVCEEMGKNEVMEKEEACVSDVVVDLKGQRTRSGRYQMDASYYYLRLRWSVPCGPNSVITFPGAPWLKPWYWWSWPVLPLGLQWHEQRRQTLGYSAEMPIVLIQSIFYIGIMAVTRLARPSLSKLCYRRADKSISLIQNGLKLVAMWSILAAYIIPFFLIPRTVHPLLGWSLYLLGSFALSSIAVNAFLLPMLPVLIPWLGIFGVLLVMAYPWYPDGVVRALSVFGYAFCYAPLAWLSLVKIMSCLQVSLEREAFLPRLGESTPSPGFNKLY